MALMREMVPKEKLSSAETQAHNNNFILIWISPPAQWLWTRWCFGECSDGLDAWLEALGWFSMLKSDPICGRMEKRGREREGDGEGEREMEREKGRGGRGRASGPKERERNTENLGPYRERKRQRAWNRQGDRERKTDWVRGHRDTDKWRRKAESQRVKKWSQAMIGRKEDRDRGNGKERKKRPGACESQRFLLRTNKSGSVHVLKDSPAPGQPSPPLHPGPVRPQLIPPSSRSEDHRHMLGQWAKCPWKWGAPTRVLNTDMPTKSSQ